MFFFLRFLFICSWTRLSCIFYWGNKIRVLSRNGRLALEVNLFTKKLNAASPKSCPHYPKCLCFLCGWRHQSCNCSPPHLKKMSLVKSSHFTLGWPWLSQINFAWRDPLIIYRCTKRGRVNVPLKLSDGICCRLELGNEALKWIKCYNLGQSKIYKGKAAI